MTILAGPEKTIVRIARVPSGEPGADARTAAIPKPRAAGLTSSAAADSSESALHLEPVPTSMRTSARHVRRTGSRNTASPRRSSRSPIRSRAVSGLVELHEVEPKQKPPILQRISEWAGAPKPPPSSSASACSPSSRSPSACHTQSSAFLRSKSPTRKSCSRKTPKTRRNSRSTTFSATSVGP